MDRNYIDNHHVVARYLADQLSEDELREFEDHLIGDPQIVSEIETAARLKAGLHKLHKSGELPALLKPRAWYSDTRWVAMAASIAIFAIGFTLWVGRDAFEAPKLVSSLSALVDGAGNPLPVANSYTILRTRGISYDAEIALPAAPQAIELRVLPEIEAHPARYRVAIQRIADDDSLSSVGAAAGLIPGDDGFVVLYFDSSAFTAGRHQLTISGDSGTDAANQVSAFKVKLIPPISP